MGSGTSVNWPSVPGDITASSNESMLRSAAATRYSVAYIGISFADDVAKAGLGTAMTGNQSGKFLLPTADTVSAAAPELSMLALRRTSG